MSNSSSIPSHIAKITAPLLFGPLINWMLYGVLSVQTYVYSYNFPDDRLFLKALAYFVFLLETVQTALAGTDVYYWFGIGFGDMQHLKNDHFSAIGVQGFYCYRIWTLNKRLLWVCVVIAILSIAQAIATAWGGINAAIVGTYVVLKPCIYLWFIASALSDILIAVAMTSLLRQTRGNEGRYSSYVLPRIVRLTIETNMLTASVAIISFVVYIAFPNDIYYTLPTGIIEKLYSNTLLLTLNNRIYFRHHIPQGSEGDSLNLGATNHTAASSLRFDQTRLRVSTTTMSHNSISLDPILRLPALEKDSDLEKGSSNEVDPSG